MLIRCLAIALLLISSLSLTSLAKSPNILLIISDDQAWNDYGFMGHSDIQTPRIDRLASEARLFPMGYVPTSLCRPSLASIATGLYPHQHMITGNDPLVPNKPKKKDDPEVLRLNERLISNIERVQTLPRLLSAAGYLSFQSGKWWEGRYSRGGFTHGMTHGDPAKGGRHGDEGLKIGREGLSPIFDFVEAAGDKPFFIWYAPFLPHTPHNPPDRLMEKYTQAGRPVELAQYYAMCEWFDETVGELLDFLDRKSLTKDTLVLYVTDNGWIQRTPESIVPSGWRFGFGPTSKRSPNERGIRTPMLLRWPGTVQAQRVETPVSSIDIVPTVLSAAGVGIPDSLPGINLLDLAAVEKRGPVFGEIFTHDIVDIKNPVKGLKQRWIVDGDWKMIMPHNTVVLDTPVQLYNLKKDPNETTNLLELEPEIGQRLYKRLQEWWPVE